MLFFTALALFFKLCLTGYGFLALVLFGIAFIISLFYALSFLAHKKLFARIRGLLAAGVCILLALLSVSAVPVIAGSFKRQSPPSDFVIVLGAGVRGTEPSRVLRQRINTAYDVLMVHPDLKAILSGGKGEGENISEAECMFRELPVVVSKTRIGEINSAIATTLAIEHYHPRMILNQGTAGALVDWLNTGDIVIGKRVC